MAADPVAWPFFTGGDYAERLDWLTDVMVAPTGNTTHRRIRQSPRVQVTFSTLEEGRARRRMESLLRDNSAGMWRVPLAVDGRRLGAAATAGATALTVDTAGARFVPGGHALLQGDDPLVAEVVQIAAGGVSSGSLTLEAELLADWPAWTRVTPLRRARLAEFPQIGRFTSDASDVVELSFRLEEALDDAPEILGDLYRGYPVWPFRPVWSSDPQWSPERGLQGSDDEVSAPFAYDLAGVPQGRVAMQYTAADRAEIMAFRKALYALAGRWSPVWVASWNSDARVVAGVANGATSIDIEGPNLAGVALASNQRDLRIELWNGTVLHRRITAVSTPSAGVERLSLDSAIATGFQSADVRLVSFIVLCTQDADTNLLRYWTGDVMECELTWRQLAHGL